MNDKFFDLKQEKQDRIINAALKVFAKNSYRHASTDEVVKEAGISKGLIFHYFESKAGLYEFLFEYSARFMLLELSREVSSSETDFFELIRQMERARMQVMKLYPYMQQFLNMSLKETCREADRIAGRRAEYEERMLSYTRQPDYSVFFRHRGTGADDGTDPICHCGDYGRDERQIRFHSGKTIRGNLQVSGDPEADDLSGLAVCPVKREGGKGNMKEKLYTIPLNDAVNADDECPFCYIERNVEQDLMDFVLGSAASYMESDVREETDREGFCRAHMKKMFDYGNTLGNGWILKTYYKKLIREMEGEFSQFKPGKVSFADRLKKAAPANSVCQWIEKRRAPATSAIGSGRNMSVIWTLFSICSRTILLLWRRSKTERDSASTTSRICAGSGQPPFGAAEGFLLSHGFRSDEKEHGAGVRGCGLAHRKIRLPQ